MEKRTKTLVSIFGVVILLVIVTKVAYPRWIEPLAKLDERLVNRQRELQELQSIEEEIRAYRKEYRQLVARIGSFDIDIVATDVRDRINELVEKHHLRADSVAPSRSRPDRKTGIESMTINVKAVGTLAAAVGFLRDVATLPQFMQLGNVAIYPASRGRDVRGPTPMNLRVPIELRVLPQHGLVGRIELDALEQPEMVARHQDRDYTPIWEGTPFDDWIPPVPLRVAAGKDQKVRSGKRVWLMGSATGGDGFYTFQWSPSDGVKSPTSSRTEVELSEPGAHEFTLTATDGKGETAGATVTVTVLEAVVRNQPRKGPKKPPPPPPRPDARWKDRKHMKLVMTLGSSTAEGNRDELMIYNRQTKVDAYYAVGDEFDGGTLLSVHQTGGLVRRKDDPRVPEGQEGYFVYPIGEQLDRDVPVEQAVDFPTLQRAADMDKSLRGLNEKVEGEANGTESAKVDPGAKPAGPPPVATLSALRKPEGRAEPNKTPDRAGRSGKGRAARKPLPPRRQPNSRDRRRKTVPGGSQQ